ncbi:MAG TPA: F0F1 ATP synthase subunit B, partial [Parvularculaceae bacterium]|nr:F0F1 ATP synthase subunit B [Parvularculaceae bacterium]
MIEILALTAAAEAAAGVSEAAAGQTMTAMLWVLLIAFAIVIAIFWRAGIHKQITGALDKRSQRIADELDQARRLREEAQELLAQYQRRQRDAEEEAKGIIDQAKKDAQRLAEESRAKIAEQIERRAKAAEDKIARAEAQALAEVRGQTVDLAVETAREIIKSRMDKSAQSALVEKAIDELRAKLH